MPAKRAATSESRSDIAGGLVARADAARDAKHYHVAAILYDEATRILADNAAIHIQCGHMFKEAGDLAKAKVHYLQASRLTPDDSDLALQLGHFYKVAGRLDESAAAYERALELRPGWPEPAHELAEFQRRWGRKVLYLAEESSGLGSASSIDRLVPELLPRKPHELRRTFVDSIQIRRLGARRERSRWGLMNALRGVEAIRGFCISSVPLLELQIALNKQKIHTDALQAFSLGGENESQLKYVFNIWFDFSRFSPGPYEIELRFLDANEGVRVHREQVVIAPPSSEAQYPDSDAVVDLSGSDHRSVEEQINARPSIVRSAKRALLARPPGNVLILRTDQLGDMVTSIPAMRRLRELLPTARFVGLLTSGNADFASTLSLFDEIIVIDFPDDYLERRRIMPLRTQEELRAKLEPYDFDMAIDLAESSVSRPLLLLSGARFLYGFYDREWPWLTAGFDGSTHDPINHLEIAPQSTKVLALVERLGATLNSKAEIIRRPDLTRETLAAYGITEADRFAVLHTGARIAFSRWPYYCQLASLILERTNLRVFLLTDDPSLRAELPLDLSSSDRFQLLDMRLPFDQFDALLSFCTIFVGNDSGPKHLAALRGSHVVSIHSARINWNEWGQELTGSIISRRVPCAGCAIFHDSEECGKGFACIVNISPEEVFEAVAKFL